MPDRYPSTPGYNIWNTPALTREEKDAESEADDILQQFSSQRLLTDSLAVEVIRQLLEERQTLRDKNHKKIMAAITEVSGQISCCRDRYGLNRDAQMKRVQLEQKKRDLECAMREEDLRLWKDASELRRELVEANKQLKATQLRSGLIATNSHDRHKKEGHQMDTGDMPGSEAADRQEG